MEVPRVRGEGGEGGGMVVSGGTEFCTSSSCPEAVSLASVGFHGTFLQSSSFFSLNC